MSQFPDYYDPVPEPSVEPSTSELRYDNQNRDLSPEPDQDLDTSRGRHQVWLVKVPKFLIDGWSQVQQEDARLGTVRVYDQDENGHQKMELLLPDSPAPAIPIEDPIQCEKYANIPRRFDMRLTSTTQETFAKNLYSFQEEVLDDEDAVSDIGVDEDVVIAGAPKPPHTYTSGPARLSSKKRRFTALTGTVTNETALQPQKTPPSRLPDSKAPIGMGTSRSLLTPEYREILRQRRMESSKPKRSVMMMDETDAGSNNMLAAGVGKGHVKTRSANIVLAASQARSNEPPEKFARMPRNELLDSLFSLFDRYTHWSLKRLREETQQPYVYLREVLSTIADQHQNGPYAGSWSLKREFAEHRQKADAAQNSRPNPPTEPSMDDMDNV